MLVQELLSKNYAGHLWAGKEDNIYNYQDTEVYFQEKWWKREQHLPQGTVRMRRTPL